MEQGSIPMKFTPPSGVWYNLDGAYGHLDMNAMEQQCTLITSNNIAWTVEDKGEAVGNQLEGKFEGDLWACVARHPWGTSPGLWSPNYPESCWYEYWSGLQHSEDFWWIKV